MSNKEQIIKSDKIYEGKLISLRIDTVEKPDRKYVKREIIEHPGVAVIIALKDDKIILTKQERIAISSTCIEVPAGIIETNELPIEAAKRELLEETGYYSNDFEFLFEAYSSPGYSDEKMYFFKASNCIKDDSITPDSEIVFLDISEFKNKINDLSINDLKTITALSFI